MTPQNAPKQLTRRFARHVATLLQPNDRLLCAVSGGSDSVALLHLLLASQALPASQIQVAHFNHNLRPDADQDAAFVATLAHQLGVACTIGQWTPPPVGHDNLPALARDARYNFLATCAQERCANRVLTAHQQDDQAETVLERLLRGSGVRGLSAMRPQRPLAPGVELLRPLLPFSRQELRHWLQQQALEWRDDPSNLNLQRRRNRMRQAVLPLIQEATAHNPMPGLAATAARLQQADAALEWMCQELWRSMAPLQEGETITLPCDRLRTLPDELQIRLFQQACRQLNQEQHPPGARAMRAILQLLAQNRRVWTMRIHGAQVRREEGVLRFSKISTAPRREIKGNS